MSLHTHSNGSMQPSVPKREAGGEVTSTCETQGWMKSEHANVSDLLWFAVGGCRAQPCSISDGTPWPEELLHDEDMNSFPGDSVRLSVLFFDRCQSLDWSHEMNFQLHLLSGRARSVRGDNKFVYRRSGHEYTILVAKNRNRTSLGVRVFTQQLQLEPSRLKVLSSCTCETRPPKWNMRSTSYVNILPSEVFVDNFM